MFFLFNLKRITRIIFAKNMRLRKHDILTNFLDFVFLIWSTRATD